jgi:hypothetical protein
VLLPLLDQKYSLSELHAKVFPIVGICEVLHRMSNSYRQLHLISISALGIAAHFDKKGL